MSVLITGTNGNNIITPSQVSNGVAGGSPGAGNHTLNGAGGGDLISGGGGDDVLRGDAVLLRYSPVANDSFASIDVGDHAAPSFVDLDGEGELELAVEGSLTAGFESSRWNTTEIRWMAVLALITSSARRMMTFWPAAPAMTRWLVAAARIDWAADPYSPHAMR